jgi:hypothetical protein
VRGLVGLKHGRQQAVRVQPIDPLAIEPIGLRPPLDLPGERGRRHDGLELRLEQGEVQHVPVRPAGLHRDRRDVMVSQPRHEVAESGRVSRELADVFRCVSDADPVGTIADIDAGGMRVLDGHRIDRDGRSRPGR